MKTRALLLPLLAAMCADAASTFYTFSGKINFIPQDDGGYAAAHNIKVGNTVTYIFEVDTTRPGFTKEKGAITNQVDSINSGTGYHADYFYDSLIAPSLFSPAVPDTTTGVYFGYHTVTKLGGNTRNSVAFQTIIGDPEATQTQILVYITDTSTTDWLPKVGDNVTVTEAYNDSNAAASSASMSMKLLAVSNTRPSLGTRGLARIPAAFKAEYLDNVLLIQNHSGERAEATILNAAGKTVVAMKVDEKLLIPEALLPRGVFVLKLAAKGRSPLLQAFSR